MSVNEKPSHADRANGALGGTFTDPSWICWAVVAGCGVILGVMGLTGSARRAADGGPAVRLVAHLPDPLIVLVLASATFTSLLVLSALLPRGVRRRKGEEEYEFYHEPWEVSPWIMVVLWLLVLLPFAVAAYLLWRGSAPFGERLGLIAHQAFSVPPRQSYIGPREAASPPLWNVAVATLALCASLGSLVLVLWVLFGERLARWWTGPLSERRHLLAQAVDESLEDLAREPDARRAIIKCYRRFEQELARSRIPRAPWQTPMEFMREALGKLPLPPGAMQRLTELFEVARFSKDPLGPADRSSAFESLVEIRAGLEQETVNASAA
jgi:hypothetical protein